MKNIIVHTILILFSIQTLAAADGLQNEDFKSLTDLTSAGGSMSQLLNDTKLYLTNGALSKQLSTAIADGSLVSTGVPFTAKGDLLTRSSTATAVLPVGTNGFVLTADSTQANGIKWASSGAGTFTAPAVTRITTGATNYTVPGGALYLEVEMCGGGGGGAPGDSQSVGATNGVATTFGTATANGGNGGQFAGAGGAGGTANATGFTSIVTVRGNTGMPSLVGINMTGGTMYFARGGAGPWGGSPNDSNANTYSANSCSGGSTGASTTSPGTRGAGGGAGGYSKFYVNAPLAGTYAYSIGTGGTGGTGTSNGFNGGDGIVIVTAHFQ